MKMPRCGVVDIINGTTSMRAGKKRHPHHHGGHGSPHTVAHYSLSYGWSGVAKWPSDKYHLTYAFDLGFPTMAMAPVSRAFATWAANTHFSFSQTSGTADLKIGFLGGDHNDGNPFDGPGGTVAHAFAPTSGIFHYDASEWWVVGAVAGAVDLETVALHEIGHLIGLGHRSVEEAVMWPSVRIGYTRRYLNSDDISGIKALYNT